MEQQNASQTISHLQNLFSQRLPKNKFFSQSRIQQFNDSIEKQIINGDTVVKISRDGSISKPKNRYQEDMRRQKLMQAKQQKQGLQKKLSYLNKSIDTIKNYSYLKAQPQINLSQSRERSPEEVQMLRRKDRELYKSVKKHKEKALKLRQQQQQKKKLLAEQQYQQKLVQQKQSKQQKRKQILQNMKKMQQNMQDRQTYNIKSRQKVKQLLNKKQLFQKMQQKYKEKQMITLEQRKRKLSQIRNLCKPIDIDEIRQHERKVQELKRQKDDIRLREKKINQSSIQYKVPYVGSYYRQILEKRSQSNDPLQSSKLRIDKIKQFGQHIRQNFAPNVDQRKRQQLQKLIQRQSFLIKQNQQKLQENLELRKQKGVEYMQYLHKIPKNRNKSTVQEQGSKTARTVYKNYLEHTISESSPNRTQQTWSKILTKKQLNKKQKAKLLQYESQRMQEHLKRKQQQRRILKKDNQQDIDQEYYNMIKAKLSLLTSQG